MTKKKQRRFKTEADEAKWWSENQGLIADRFEQAKAAGKLGRGTFAKMARDKAGASPTITIRLAESDLARARALAARKGLRYQTYIKMLLHEALETEEKGGVHKSLAEKLSALRTEDYFRERAARSSIRKAKDVLKRAGKGKPPIPGDEK